jgi:ribonucleoside-diphosphate reductase alpha chain
MTKITLTRKRDGSIADFKREKITSAMRGAFMEVKGTADELLLSNLTESVLEVLDTAYGEEGIASVERVQDAVEQVLMKEGYFDVAKAYIIYRYSHEKVREQQREEVVKKIEEEGLMITKRNGQLAPFNSEKLAAFVRKFTTGLDTAAINVDMLVRQCKADLYEGIKSRDIQKAIVLAARSHIERDPDYSRLAARMLLDMNLKEIIGKDTIDYADLENQHRIAFIAYIQRGVQIGLLDPRMLTFDLTKVSKALKLDRDNLFDYLGAQTLAERYCLADPKTKQTLETPQMFWMRVSMGLCLLEGAQKEDVAIKFYEQHSSMRWISSSPTLFNAGTTHAQLSSCYLTTVSDDLHHIFKCMGDNAQLAKFSGGIGNDWSNLRATGARIKSTNIESQGVIPFLKIANDTTVAINRSGRRRGATVAYLETWHFDIEEFLELRKNTGDERRRTHDMNTCNWIPDLFMKRVRDDGEWTLFSPDEVPELHHVYGAEFERRYAAYEAKARRGEIYLYKVVKAKDIWRKMISMLFETGHPWMTWKDPSNVRSPQDHVGVVHSSNLCTEITLNTSADETAVCNLGSIDMGKHIVNGQLDMEMLKETTITGMHMLDNVIDLCYYPTKEAKESNMKHRPVGLGIMGFQDALYKLNINFETEDAVTFADRSMEAISYFAITASALLAKEKGPYTSFRGSKWDRGILPLDTLDVLERERGEKIPVDRSATMDWDVVRELIKEYGMRNSNCMALAPTASISTISGCFPTLEPIYKNIYVKSNITGEFTVVNEYLVTDLKARGLWDEEMLNEIKRQNGSIGNIVRIPTELKEKYKEVFDINPLHLVKVTAYRGKWIDQAQSFNIFYKGTSGKELTDIYFYAWQMGMKTTYYLRTMAASNVEKSTVSLDASSAGTQGSSIMQAPKSTPAPSAPVATPTPVPAPTPVVASAPAPVPVTTATANTPSNETIIGPDGVPVKLCKINDPDCLACQ